jgi:hypothetical protein
MLQLNCLVLNDKPAHNFVIDIKDTETVDALREAIKHKLHPKFEDVPAAALVLWRDNQRITDIKDSGINAIPDCDQWLLAGNQLSKVFLDSPPDPDNLHIIVECSPTGKCE